MTTTIFRATGQNICEIKDARAKEHEQTKTEI